MRPGISPGNAGSRAAISGRCTTGGGGFNEAGGFLPRKRADAEGHRVLGCPSFNEAGGFLPRKRAQVRLLLGRRRRASMRPGDFSPGNFADSDRVPKCLDASMRPGDFSPGNAATRPVLPFFLATASMRPGDFSPGNSARPPPSA